MSTNVELLLIYTEAQTALLFAHKDNRGSPQSMALLDDSTLQHVVDQIFDLLEEGRWDGLISLPIG